MSVIRLSADPKRGRVRLYGADADPQGALGSAAAGGDGPVVIMIHGYKYDPGIPHRCPHRRILNTDDPMAWPAQLGLNDPGALGIAFGWRARGSLRRAFRRAGTLGRDLARILRLLQQVAPHRPVHIITHSMGAEIALKAMKRAPERSIGRLVMLTGASFGIHAQEALSSPAGRSAEVINVISRENDLFDFAFERLIPAPTPGARALGHGITAPNAVNVQLDCAETLRQLRLLGHDIAPSQRRICHWSGYTRPGALTFYGQCLHPTQAPALAHLKAILPQTPAPRWARLSLGLRRKTGMMAGHPMGNVRYEHSN